MWWLVGLFSAIGVILLYRRGSKIAAHEALVTAAQNQLRTSFYMLTHDLPLRSQINPRVWKDEYLLGYAQGTVAVLVKIFGRNLTTEQRGQIFVDTVRNLAPLQWMSICDEVWSLAKSRDPSFVEGGEHAANVVGLAMNRLRPEVLLEPDIQIALAEAPAMERLSNQLFGADVGVESPFSSAGAALMSMYMERHRITAGY